MRIHIHIPVDQRGQTRTLPASVPAQLAELAPKGELVLIEIQGSLEMDLAGQDEAYDDDAPDQLAPAHILGSLSWEKGFAEHPVLTIARHRLQGKVVTLQKPLAVLQKKRRTSKREEEEPRRKKVRKAPPEGLQEAQHKYPDEEEQEVLQSSPPGTPERQAMPYSDAVDFSSSPSRLGDLPSVNETREAAPQAEDDSLSSTPTYYEVVSLIRKKIVFSKRPEPIVH